MENYNKVLREFRKKKRIKVLELAKASGIHYSTVSRIENGWSPVTPEYFDDILCGYCSLGVDTAELSSLYEPIMGWKVTND